MFKDLALPKVYPTLEDFLHQWRNSLPDFPELNFDLHSQETVNQLVLMKQQDLKKLFTNSDVVEQILPIIFPTGEALKIYKDLEIVNPELKLQIEDYLNYHHA